MIYSDGKPTSGVSATGVVGTVLGGTALAAILSQGNNCGNGGGLFGGLFGGNCNNGGCKQVDHDTRVISALESELAKEKSERYTDGVAISVFEREAQLRKELEAQINSNFKEAFVAIAALDKASAVTNENVSCNLRYLDSKIDNNQKEMYCYVNGNFVPGKLIMPLDNICPRPLAGCTPITTNAQVIATAPAPTAGEVNLNSAKK